MKKIDIEVFFQNNNSIDCGPVSVKMLLNHFGVEKDLTELKKVMWYDDGGTYIFDNALAVLRENLKATIITANPLLYKVEDRKALKSAKAIRAHLTKMQRKLPKKKKAIQLCKDFIDKGGKVKIEVPDLSHIRHALDKGGLVLALVHAGALGKNEGGFHFVVVSGHKKGYVHINNPYKKSRQGWFPEKDFLYALHASTCVAIDNGSLLIVESK